ncbi:biotin-dependent carboxyltransferase family protein [uncultured Methylovirgula sp.]|uniref:5-oxoprolinase subunit C family protein n=1 Tax=uncultured Methylovirgula sp. TaxID=1285960 RepID=UPI0026032415|nr:biotin-dependent carboxyltransferase family protein [uncultured Methylovirgula sp.]
MAHLRILGAGPGATIQDGGRFGYRRYGVTPAGPMDWVAFRTANLALGNAADAAAVEIGPGGLELIVEADAPVSLAFCGGGFAWFRGGQLVGAAARLCLAPGEILAARPGVAGIFTYLAVAGGLRTPIELGSRATYARAGMGGLNGGLLRAGDDLPLEASTGPCADDAMIVAPWLRPDPDAPLRVVLGPQDDYFDPAARDLFFSAPFRVVAGDRMAYRLDGPPVAHSRGYNIVSDGVALGAIQIAGDKKPLVLMADHPPTGGYPKLGHVARADIGRLAQLRPGRACRFAEVGAETARRALQRLEDEIATTTNFCRPLRRQVALAGVATPDRTAWSAAGNRHPR